MLGAALVVACSAAGRTPRGERLSPSAAVEVPSLYTVSPSARHDLLEHMAQNRANINELRWTAPSLEFERVVEIASTIANASLPELAPASAKLPQFFEFADMRARAMILAESARARNSRGVLAAYGGLVAACNRCHVHYGSQPPILPTLPLAAVQRLPGPAVED